MEDEPDKLIAIPLLLISMVFKAFVFKEFWDWFVVPTFGAPSLSVYFVVAATLAYSMMKYDPSRNTKVTWRTISENLLVTPIAYGTMFVVTLFM